MSDYKIEEVTRRIPGEVYGFFEVKMTGFETLEEVEALAKQARQNEAKERYGCEHLWRTKDSGTKKGGGRWVKEACLNSVCGAIRWENEDGSWSNWQYPIR